VIELREAGPDDAEALHALMIAAFSSHASLDPPSGALKETVEVVREALTAAPGVLLSDAGKPVACLRIELHDDVPYARRVAVHPDHQGRGLCRLLMQWFETWAGDRGSRRVGLGVRLQLPGNRALYEHLGYVVVAEHAHPETGRPMWVEMSKDLP
jgi:GNAT superfamily N-acetyltransferase